MLWEEMPIGGNVQVACLPRLQWLGYPFPNTKRQQALFAGWGRNESESSVGGHKELKNMRTLIYDPSDPTTLCNQNVWKKDWNSQICTGDLNGKYTRSVHDIINCLYVKYIFIFN